VLHYQFHQRLAFCYNRIMSFSGPVKEEALVRSRRCCCVCHEFAGLFVNVHHVIPESQKGSSDLDNAIVLCLRCHGEAGHYNSNHPIGNKYSSDELIRHRDEWWEWCINNPEAPLHKVPISVSPTVIKLQGGEWKATCNFKVQNRTEEIYYDVVVKIGIQDDCLSAKDIAITLTNSREYLCMQLGDIIVSADIFQIRAIDESNQNAIFIYVKSIDPKEILTFLLQNTSSEPHSGNIRPKALLSVCGFSKSPAATSTGPSKVAIAFRPPENIQVESIALLLRKGQLTHQHLE